MAKAESPDSPDASESCEEAPNFETALTRLEGIVLDLEDGDLGLAEALARYESGVKLLKQCYGLLDNAQRRIELLTGVDAAGNPVSRPFDDESTISKGETAREADAPRTPGGASGGRRRPKPPKTTSAPPAEAEEEPSDVDEPRGLF